MKPVKSSNISAVGYDAQIKLLSVEFKSGDTLTYRNVTPKQYKALMDADSKGGWLASNVVNRPVQHPYVKVSNKKKNAMSNAIINQIQAKIDEIGVDAAAIYYSGKGPKGKITGARLTEMLTDNTISPRMAVKVCEDLRQEAHNAKLAFDGLKMLRGDRLTPEDSTPLSAEELQKWKEQNAVLQSENLNLARDNADLLARIRQLESQAIAHSGVASQGFPIVPAIMTEPLADRQPWNGESVEERAAQVVQPWTRATMRPTPTRMG